MEPEKSTFDTTILRKAGLTESQAKGYLALVEHGSLTPAKLAEHTGESRTNGYMICEKLEKLGLATKNDGKTTTYSPTHPSALETLAERRRKALVRNEEAVRSGMGELLDFFYTHQSTPGVETFYGERGIEKIRERTLRKGQELLFVRSPHDSSLDAEALKRFIGDRVQAGIAAQSIASNQHSTTSSREQLDAWLLDRTLVPGDIYSAPVEIDIFGDTVAFIDFENDGMSTLITSETIAEAMRQLFQLAKQAVDATTDQEQLLREKAEQPTDDTSQS